MAGLGHHDLGLGWFGILFVDGCNLFREQLPITLVSNKFADYPKDRKAVIPCNLENLLWKGLSDISYHF